MKIDRLFYFVGAFFVFKLLLVSFFLGLINNNSNNSVNEISYGQAIELVESKNIKELRFDEQKALLIDKKNIEYNVEISEPQKSELLNKSFEAKITTFIEPANSTFFSSESSLLGYLFQIVFILFFISPPIIVVLLFCIWKELKRHNDMK